MRHRGDVTRVTEDLITSAERDSVRIVATAKAQIHQTILRSEHELHLLAAQTQAMLDLLQVRELEEQISRRNSERPAEFPASARDVLSNLMRESRAELAALASEPVPLAPLVRFQVPDIVAVVDAPERKTFATLSRPPVDRRFRAALAAAAVLILSSFGLWWGLQRTVDGPSEVQPVATAGGAAPPMQVEIEARRPVWIRVGVDGQADSGRLFGPGEKHRFTAAQEVSIRAGDAGAVLVSVNGGRAAALGRDGQVVTRRVRPNEGSEVASSSGTDDEAREEGGKPPALANADTVAKRSTTSASGVETPDPIRQPGPSSDVVSASPGAIAGNAPSGVRSELTAAAQRWLQAYYVGDRERMAAASSPNVSITDERAAAERLPSGLAGVQRTFEEATVQVFGSDALLTAKLIERSGNVASGPTAESVAFLSQMWTRQRDAWKLTQIRIVSAAALEKMVNGR